MNTTNFSKFSTAIKLKVDKELEEGKYYVLEAEKYMGFIISWRN